tara:strand:- start:1771 stop:2382 length:612 start_codon:yes stop_codon:yes gene_type:complete
MLKKYFIAGLLFWVPVIVTMVVIDFFITIITTINTLLPANMHPEQLFGFKIPGFGFILGIFLIVLTGAGVANFFGNKLLKLWEAFLARIPLVRSIYSAVKQSMQVVFSSSGESFRQVVMLEYPRKGLWSVGFVTNVSKSESKKNATYTVFVPTTPNPTSGYLLVVPKNDLTFLDLPVDVALKMVISLGTIMPCDLGEYIKDKV